jgi:hypothetical protein
VPSLLGVPRAFECDSLIATMMRTAAAAIWVGLGVRGGSRAVGQPNDGDGGGGGGRSSSRRVNGLDASDDEYSLAEALSCQAGRAGGRRGGWADGGGNIIN